MGEYQKYFCLIPSPKKGKHFFGNILFIFFLREVFFLLTFPQKLFLNSFSKLEKNQEKIKICAKLDIVNQGNTCARVILAQICAPQKNGKNAIQNTPIIIYMVKQCRLTFFYSFEPLNHAGLYSGFLKNKINFSR